jgi:small subunit ribosomal protein S4e
MKNHLKRIASPSTWQIDRKSRVFTVRPKPGAHPLDKGMAMGVILRDKLNLAKTMSEVKKLLNQNEILVDGKRKKDYRLIVGLFDVLSVKTTGKNYRVILDSKGRVAIKEIDGKESSLKVCKVVGKTTISKGKIQLNLHDGKNILSDADVKVGDSLLLSLPKLEVKKVLPLKNNTTVFLTDGKHAGLAGQLKEIKNNEAIFVVDGKDIETAKKYLFVVGEQKAEVTIN